MRTVTSQGNLILAGDTRSDKITWGDRVPIVYKTTSAGLYLEPSFSVPWSSGYVVNSQPIEFVLNPFRQYYQTLEVQISRDSTFNTIDIQYNDPSIFTVDQYGTIRFMVSGFIANSDYFIRCRAVDFEGKYAPWSKVVKFRTGNITNVNDEAEIITFDLKQNYPKLFYSVTKISYSTPEKSFVILKIYDVLGNEVAELIQEEKQTGNYSISFDASSLPSGVYFYILKANGYSATKKMVLVK